MIEILITLCIGAVLSNMGINLALFIRIEHRLTTIENKLEFTQGKDNACQQT